MSREPLESRFTKQDKNISEFPFPKSLNEVFSKFCLFDLLEDSWCALRFQGKAFFFCIQGLSPAVELKLWHLH